MAAWCTAEQVKARSGMGQLPSTAAAEVAASATNLLDLLTGRRFASVTRTIRPSGCGHTCDYGPPSERAVVGWGLAVPLARVVGPWPLPGPYGGMAAQCADCSCWHSPGIELDSPVWDEANPITVKVDGVALDPGAWVLISWRSRQVLTRVDGGAFPRCQNLLLADDQPGTCSVTYTSGDPVPAAGVQAAVSLAVELAKYEKLVPGDCKLPQRITSITRQGVSVAVLDPLDVIRNGGTGLTDVDLFLAAVNPNGLRRRARMLTPGVGDDQPTVRAGT